jgi:hypothetical protein
MGYGYAPNCQHFTGSKRRKRVRRKGKGKTRKQRMQNRGAHVNRYSQTAG